MVKLNKTKKWIKPGPQMIKAATKANDLATWDANLNFQ